MPYSSFDSTLTTLTDVMFSWLPIMMLIPPVCYALAKLIPILFGTLDERAEARRDADRKLDSDEKAKALLDGVLGVRVEFDHWLESQGLRLQIDVASAPDSADVRTLLEKVEAAKVSNAKAIVALATAGPAARVSDNDAAAVQREWDELAASVWPPKLQAA